MNSSKPVARWMIFAPGLWIPLLLTASVVLGAEGDSQPGPPFASEKEGVLPLLDFEPVEIERISKTFQAIVREKKLRDGTPYTSASMSPVGEWSIVQGKASSGNNALILRLTRLDYFKSFAIPQATIDFYGTELDNWSNCFVTTGSFRRLFPKDWSAYDTLRFDVFAKEIPITLRIALEDEEIAPPVVRNIEIEPGKWSTCEIDLKRAQKERGLNLKRMATLTVAIVDPDKKIKNVGNYVYLGLMDHLRLAKKSAATPQGILRDDSPHKLPPLYQPSAGPKPETLPPGKPDHSPLPVTKPIVIKTPDPLFVNMSGWVAAYDNKHLSVGFHAGGATNGKTGVLTTGDGGATWTGLDGKQPPTWFSTPYPDHQCAAGTPVGKRSDILLFTNLGCIGRRNSGARLFARHLEFTGKGWKLRELPALVDSDLRHCNSNQSVVRSQDGRLWAAYGLAGRLGTICINTRYSDDDGLTWKATRPGTSGLVPGTLHSDEKGVGFGYTFEEPCIVPLGKGIACLWQFGRGPVKWSRFDGKSWTPIEEIETAKVKTAYNPTRPGLRAVHVDEKEIFCVSGRYDGVLHFSGGKWTHEATDVPAGSRITVAGGKIVSVISTGIRESRAYKFHQGPVEFSIWQRQADGSWLGPRKLLTETEPLSRNDNAYAFRPAFVVPPYSPPNLTPLAWTCHGQNWIKVLKIPVPWKK